VPRVADPPGTTTGRPRTRLRAIVAVSASIGLSSCGGASRGPDGNAPGGGAAPVEVRAAADRPKLALVAREGDPFSAVGIAVAHDLGAVASIWLAALLEDRLEKAFPSGTEPRASGNGFVLAARVRTADEARRYVAAAARAFALPVGGEELTRIAEHVRTGPPPRVWASAADAAVSACIGELGVAAMARPPSAAELERFRTAVRARDDVAFAAVGPRKVLEAVEDALGDTAEWPSGSALADPWPAANVVGTTPSADAERTLSVAFRMASVAKAVEAARVLGDRDGPLAAHAAVLEPSWAVERVVATSRARGACLRVDLGVRSEAAPSPRDGASVADLVIEEVTRALDEARGEPWRADQGVLESTDPREAAAVAAWRALGEGLEPGPTRTFVSLGVGSGPRSETADRDLSRALVDAAAIRRRKSLEVREAVEAGQGELWLLLGSPCATASESSKDAGVSALAVRSLARQRPAVGEVRIEPWVSGDGIGLLAHGPREPGESATDHARRIALVLGKLFAATEIVADFGAEARLRLQGELDPETEPLWPVALEALAPHHPSLLDPRGTWQSITDLSAPALDAQRRALVRGPLTLAVLSNSGPDQAAAASVELERWLEPPRAGNPTCAAPPALAANPGVYEVDAPASLAGSRALLGVLLPRMPSGGIADEAAFTVHLLNRPGGWLDRAVRIPGLAVHAEAALLGGADAAALVVELSAQGQSARAAAEQVRALWARLAEGATTTEDVVAATNAAAEAAEAVAVDPRHRIVRLWLGRKEPRTPDLASMRKFHREAFGPDRHVVVLTRVRP
jgi:hypothetical protein